MRMRSSVLRTCLVVASCSSLVLGFVACGGAEEGTTETPEDQLITTNDASGSETEEGGNEGKLPDDPPAMDTDGGLTGNDDDLDAGTSAGTDGGGTKDSGPTDSGVKDSGVKDSGVKDSGVTNPAPADLFKYNLDVINFYRASKGIAALKLDTQLNTFAQAGSVQLSKDHIPHNHFKQAGTSLFSQGFKTMAAENQGDPNGWPVLNTSDAKKNQQLQIDAIQKAMFNEGPGAGAAHGHYTNMMNAKYKRVGVGLYSVNGKLYLTNDFSD